MAISPVDGRYVKSTHELSPYFSEYALMKYRVWVEVEYLIALAALPIPQLKGWGDKESAIMRNWVELFSEQDAEKIKEIEKTTNHDVKAVEYSILVPSFFL